MDDTDPKIKARLCAMMKAKTGQERLLMGFSMYDSARVLALRFIRTTSTSNTKRHLFLRFYGSDFDTKTRDHIIQCLGD
jgi:hypothetical protein